VKGLVLAGGSGTRLRPLTYTGAKQLVPVGNKPVLFYVVENLVAAGIREIAVILSPETGREIERTLGDGGRFGARFTFVLQDRPAGLAHAVATARPFLEGDAFAMYLGDNLIGSGIAEMVAAFARSSSAASVLLKSVPNPTAFGVAELDRDGRLVRLVEKPAVPPSDLALVGVYLFRPVIFDAIARIRPSARGELEITDAIAELLSMGHVVDVTKLDAWWLDTGKKDDLLLANDTVLDDWLVAKNEGESDSHSRLSGRIAIGKGSRLVRSTVRGPVVIGEGVEIVDAKIGPFTSIGDRVRIERSTLEHSVVMEGSSIVDIARLEDSLVGRRVIVRPGPARHGALSLMVGDDCVIELTS
jgi:glucose-1-phosphate thymidylyltransferase